MLLGPLLYPWGGFALLFSPRGDALVSRLFVVWVKGATAGRYRVCSLRKWLGQRRGVWGMETPLALFGGWGALVVRVVKFWVPEFKEFWKNAQCFCT